MTVAVITLSRPGLCVARRILPGFDTTADLFLPSTFPETDAEKFPDGVVSLSARIFPRYGNLVYIMPLGVVVRCIAAHVHDKHTDPAVAAVDVAGRYVISLLSGHEGGANALSLTISNILRTEAVITTSTEAIKDLIVGIGCREGIDHEAVVEAVQKTLQDHQLSFHRVRLLATADIKANEKGLIRAARLLNVPLRIVSSEEIKACAKYYKPSDFVFKKVGLYGVSEPAALLAGRKTLLLIEKTRYPGITIAVARENFTW